MVGSSSPEFFPWKLSFYQWEPACCVCEIHSLHQLRFLSFRNETPLMSGLSNGKKIENIL